TSGLQIFGVDASGSLYMVQQETNSWQNSIIWRDTNALYALAAVELMPTIPGNEIVVGGASGVLTLLCNSSPILNLAMATEQRAVLSWTALKGLSYDVEMTTNLNSSSSWALLSTNLSYAGAFSGTLSYTNTELFPVHERYF